MTEVFIQDGKKLSLCQARPLHSNHIFIDVGFPHSALAHHSGQRCMVTSLLGLTSAQGLR